MTLMMMILNVRLKRNIEFYNLHVKRDPISIDRKVNRTIDISD